MNPAGDGSGYYFVGYLADYFCSFADYFVGYHFNLASWFDFLGSFACCILDHHHLFENLSYFSALACPADYCYYIAD
jgi:hypothetical protein